MTGHRGYPSWFRLVALLASVLLLAIVTAGCASLPESSQPQALGTINREPARNGPPPPVPGRDPDLLLRDFLQATAAPANRHLAARQYMTPAASTQWDDTSSTAIVEKADTLRESRTEDEATYVVRADKVGELGSDGSYRATEGLVENRIEMSRVGGEWRIDELPDGVVMEYNAFRKSYQRHVLYFLDPNGKTAVPDLRWLAEPPERLTQRLLSLLIEGPQPNIAPVVRNMLDGRVALRGPITKGDGDTVDAGVGLGGVRVDFSGINGLGDRDRELLAAQVVLTLSEADVLGPYTLLSEGKPLDERFAGGWEVGDLGEVGESVRPRNRVGLHALRDGSLVHFKDSGVEPVPGYFGSVANLQSAGLSPDGQLVAAVADSGRPPPDPPRTLMVGIHDGGDVIPVASGTTVSRPSWTGDGSAAWAVIDGERVVRVAHDRNTGNVSLQDVDISALTETTSEQSPRLPITELRVSRSGARAAFIADGKVYIAVVQQRPDGTHALTSPVPLALGLSTNARSLSWLAGDSIIIAREGDVEPVVSVSIDGSQQIPQTQQNLTPPVRVVAASPETQYVADSRAVLQLQYAADPSTSDRFWREVPGLTGKNVLPVLPG